MTNLKIEEPKTNCPSVYAKHTMSYKIRQTERAIEVRHSQVPHKFNNYLLKIVVEGGPIAELKFNLV